MTQNERWKDIPKYEGLYQASDLGNIRSIKFGKVITMKLNLSWGYFKVNLYQHGKVACIRVHRLVAITFHENQQGKPQVNHINGIKTDNRAENLEWCTRSENQKHAFKNELQKSLVGVKNPMSKLNDLQVRQIMLLRRSGLSLASISKKYNISFQHVSRIVNRSAWSHLNLNQNTL